MPAQLVLRASSDPLVTQALRAHPVPRAPSDRREGQGLRAIQTQGQAALRELPPRSQDRLAVLVLQDALVRVECGAITATTARRVVLDRWVQALRVRLARPAIQGALVRCALALLVPRARPESTAKTAVTATMARQDRPAILVQMGTMAQTATKVLRALKDPRATRATKAMQV